MRVPPRLVLCNGAALPEELDQEGAGNTLRLEYEEGKSDPKNVKVSLPNFVRSVNYVPPRLLDLLEIAVYVFLADRSTPRGSKSYVEYQSWARSMRFAVRVRDFEFWSKPDVGRKLAEALRFMSGDQDYSFAFQPGHSTLPTSLFDSEEFNGAGSQAGNSVVLFSGGLDSLAGVVERLETTSDQLCLVSHRSGPSIKRTQDKLFETLKNRYPKRLTHYKFDCSLSGVKAREETQRTRSFLYTSIAYALSAMLSQDKKFSIYENGITSINFPKRQDMGNSRTSRTTHPKTIALLKEFFSEVEGAEVEIATPYLWKTKTDVFSVLSQFGQKNLITSSVSCGSTRRNLGQATHCGGCSQCVDRRLGAYGAELDDTDEGGIYASNFIQERPEGEDRTTLMDYVRQAREFATWSEAHFYQEKLDDLIDLTDYLPDMPESEAVECVWSLCKRHGEQVMRALKRIQVVHDDLRHNVPDGSLLQLINEREYLKEPVLRLASAICERLSRSIPLIFQQHQPVNEPDLNDKVSGVLNTERDRVR